MTGRDLPRGYRFGLFDVDRVSGELRRDGVRVRLRGKPFDLLLALLDAGGDVVSRKALHATLWPDETVDFEASLNAAVKRLRESLGDSSRAPRCVETIPRRGYRFLMQAEPIETPRRAVGSGARAQTEDRATAGRPRRFVLGLVLGALVTVVAVLAVVQLSNDRGRPDTVKKKLLVLPFEDLGGDPDQEFFADGLTEEMIAQLGRLNPEQLGVIARTSAMRYRGVEGAIDAARRDLGIDYALEGAVRREAGHLRVTATLVQVSDQTQVWASTFDGELRDVLALQGDIAREIAGALAVRLLPETSRRLASPPAVDPLAFEATLRGRHHLAQQTGPGFRSAADAFREAIETDPRYAPAWSGLADTWAMLGIYDFVRPSEAFPQAREAAQTALALDPDLAEAHATLGLIACAYDWDCAAAEVELRTALELNPAYATAHHWYGTLLNVLGHHSEALEHLDAARLLDPLSRILLSDIGWQLFMARDYDAAVEQLQAVVELDPHFLVAHDNLAWVYFQRGNHEKYIEHAMRALELEGEDPADVRAYREYYDREGWRALRLRSARGMARDAATKYVSPYDIALEYAAIAERDQALDWLRKSVDQREVDMVVIRVDPRLDSLREDPRFDEIVRSVTPRAAEDAGTH